MWFRSPATVAKEDSGATSIEWLDRRPGVGGRDRDVDGAGWLSEYDVPGGLRRADYCGRLIRSADATSAFLPWT